MKTTPRMAPEKWRRSLHNQTAYYLNTDFVEPITFVMNQSKLLKEILQNPHNYFYNC